MEDQSLALVSRKLTEDGAAIGYMYRDEWSGEDSGWRLFTGDEDALFFMDPDRMVSAKLKDLTASYPELEPLLEAPAGTVYRRGPDGEFREETEAPEGGGSALVRALAEHSDRRNRVTGWLVWIALAAVLYLVIRHFL